MALMSPPIAVADATPVLFSFSGYRTSCNVQVRFYTDADGIVSLSPLGTGSRALAFTNTSSAFEGAFADPGTEETFNSNINGSAVAAAVDGTWYKVDLLAGLQNLTIASAANVTPGTAVTYRIIVDVQGSSGLA
jgi:hypothetical protein